MQCRESLFKIGDGRLAIPSHLVQNTLWHAVLYGESLRLYPNIEWERLTAAILSGARGRVRDAAIRVILNRAVQVRREERDGRSSLELPRVMLKALGLSRSSSEALLVSFSERLELWAPARYEVFLKEAEALLAASAEACQLLD